MVELITAVRSYRCTPNTELPIEVFALMDEIGTTSVSYIIEISTKFDTKLSTSALVVKVPTPLNAATVKWWVPENNASKSKYEYVHEENVLVWE